MSEIYISTDLEPDGPIPGAHSMLSIGSVPWAASERVSYRSIQLANVSFFEESLHEGKALVLAQFGEPGLNFTREALALGRTRLLLDQKRYQSPEMILLGFRWIRRSGEY